MVTDIQNLVIDKASRIIDVISHHLDESPACRHTLDEILEDIDSKKVIGSPDPTTKVSSASQMGVMKVP